MGFGGPHAGYMAVRKGLERQLPGRLVGVSMDADGAPGATGSRCRPASSTSAGRRRRATSAPRRCCSRSIAGMYAVYHGPDGLRGDRPAGAPATPPCWPPGLRAADGVEVVHDAFFDTVLCASPGRADAVVAAAARARRQPAPGRRRPRRRSPCDETTTREHLRGGAGPRSARRRRRPTPTGWPAEDRLPAALRRDDAYLTHPVFHEHRSETAMLRYLRRLSDQDLALDRSMIPLGSCTMKLNATAEMEPITWPEFAGDPPVRADRAGRRATSS